MKLMKARRNFRRSNAVMTFDFCSERLLWSIARKSSEEKEPFQPSAHWALGSRPLYFDLAQQARERESAGGEEKKFPN